jgi:hypothetical protein
VFRHSSLQLVGSIATVSCAVVTYIVPSTTIGPVWKEPPSCTLIRHTSFSDPTFFALICFSVE